MQRLIITAAMTLLLGLALPSLCQGETPADAKADAETGLEQALELDRALDASLRELALDAGRTVSFTLAAGRGLRTAELEKLLAAYETALAARPDNPLAAAGKARILAALKRGILARRAYEDALRLDPGNRRLRDEMEALESSEAPRAKFMLTHARSKEYLPWYNRHIYETSDTTYQAQAEAPVAENLRLGAGYLWGVLRQASLVYGDDDFNLKRRGYFLATQWQPGPEWQVNLRVRRELYSANDDTSFFKMPGDQELITGHFLAQYTQGPWWFNASHSRERDTWPEVDAATGRGVLRIKAKELTGVALGRALDRDWELVGSLFHESYETSRPDQFNLNAQLIHRPVWLPGLRLALGAGHYHQEAESLVNLLVGYQIKLGESLALDISQQLEYARNERSWLTQVDAALTWRPLPRLGLTLLGSYGREHHGDQDEYWSLELGLDVLF